MHLHFRLISAFFAFFLVNKVHGANIMFFFGVSSYSHRIAVWPYAEALASRGHQVTFVSPYKAKQPNVNVTDYVPVSLRAWVDAWDELSRFHAMRLNGEMELEWYKLFVHFGAEMCKILMGDEVYVDWLRSRKFDLFVVDSLVNECAYGMAYLHKAKVIVYDTALPFPWYVEPFGIPDESSWLPDFVYHYNPTSLTFYQRAVALFNPLYFSYIREWRYFPLLEEQLRKSLNLPEMPSISSLERNTSLLFINQHFAEDYPRPLPPNVIPVPGVHLQPSTKDSLPKDLQKFLQDGRDFVYMSFGSFADPINFPPEIRNALINVLERLKNVQVVWKTELAVENLPSHIYIAKWVPQQAILAHPKIRAFITHAGLLGIQEAISSSVPLIAFPIFAEQDYNAEKLEWRKVGIKLEISSITETQFETAIHKLLSDSSYSENMKKLSKRFLDVPVPPVETALWWTEYVLRHDFDETSSPRPLSIYQAWWKRRQLDIWFCVFLSVVVLFRISYIIAKYFVKFLFQDKSEKLKVF